MSSSIVTKENTKSIMRSSIQKSLEDSHRAIEQLQEEKNILFIERAAALIAETFRAGGKLIIAGNGGSLCDGSHFAEELTGIFRKKRKALPAIVLSEPGHLTCTANDLGYEWVFARGVEAFGKPNDIFVALTTSGKSPNLIRACETAKDLGLKVITFLGKEGGQMLGMGDLELLISGFSTSDRIQEAHMTAIHIIIELIEAHLFDAHTISRYAIQTP